MAIPRGAARAVSFDYGHVLGGLDLSELARRFVEGDLVEADAPLAPLVARMRQAMPAAFAAHDASVARGEGHARGWHALMRVLVASTSVASEPDVDPFVERLWRDQPTRNLWRDVPPEAHALVESLARAHVPMVITSNSEGRAKELLAELGVAQRMVDVLDSGVLGVSKPDRRIFEAAARSLGVPLSHVVHVGDSETADVVGAKEAGAFAIRFDAFVPATPTSKSRPTVADACASTFDELRALLEDALDRTL